MCVFYVNKTECLYFIYIRQPLKRLVPAATGASSDWCQQRLVPPGTAAAATATEEFSATTRPHPIMRRDSIPRSGNPSLRFNIALHANYYI